IKVCYFLIEFAFTQSDFAYALKLFLKVFFSESRSVIFKTFIVHRKTFNSKLLHNLRSPFTKLHRSFGIYLVTNRNNSRKIIVFGVILFIIIGSYSKISNN